MNINDILRQAVARGASDLHVTVGHPPILRVDGSLKRLDMPILSWDDTENLARQLLTEDKFSQFTAQGEVDISYSNHKLGHFRASVYRQREAVGIAVRLLNNEISSFEALGLPPAVATLARLNRGLILVTGPTGSGKSTTLAAMIDLINKEKEYHIITLEDPIEYIYHNNKSIITQREIGRDSISFASGLRAALRQDSDVIMVGEMRDLETISTAITAAETGHLVLATLHTIDASQTVERIIDVFPSNQQQQIRFQLSAFLAGVISQRLLRRNDIPGRIAAFELLICTPAVRKIIREGKTHQLLSIMQTGVRQGMQNFDKHLQVLYEKGYISREEVMENATDESIHEMLKKNVRY